jgi:hypothetical protein
MNPLKMLCLLSAFYCLQSSLSAQDKLNIKFGKVKLEDFDIKSEMIDSGTNAVVVANTGKSSFMANTNDLTFSLLFTEKKRIKIINKNGFDAATVTIPLYVGDNNKSEKLEDLDAYTYNIENGKVVETKVDKSSVFTEKSSKNLVLKKFTFPAIKEGSIIEYSYKVNSDFFFNLQPWTFQEEYPVLWSQYEAGIPEFFKYVTLSQGYHPFFINKSEKSQASFSFVEHVARDGGTWTEAPSSGINSFKVEGSIEYHTWVMKNVPALKEESFTTTLSNAVAKIEFQLNQVAFPNSVPRNYLDSWEKVATDLMARDDFGVPIDRPNNWLDDATKDIVKTTAAKKEKAQKIFEYVRDNFTWNEKDYSIYITSGLKEVFKNKNGSAADINMLLIAMLKNQKINVNPVILSTRDHGITHEYYPLINRYNYVIAKVEIDNEVIYLDAAASRLTFGKLPSKVYNGQAREITKNLAAPVYFLADSLKETDFIAAFVSNMEKGTVEGNLRRTMGAYESLKFRNKMAGVLPDDIKKSLQQNYSEELEIDNIQIDSLRLLKEPVKVNCKFKLKSFGDEDVVYFNPMLGQAIKKNPFTAAERFYPVEMPYTIDNLYTLAMEIPKGYKVDELPKSVRLNFNENEGMFEYLISAGNDLIQMRCRLLLKKATYLNEDYQALRDFYGYVVKKQAEQIVFKKIK